MPHKDPDVRAAYHAAYEDRRRGQRTAYLAAWRAAHPDKIKAYNREAVASGRNRTSHARHAAEHRAERAAAQRAYTARRRVEDNETFRAMNRAAMARYRERAADPTVTWTDVESDACGVCQEPLQPEAAYPDPMATTIGHEPPLSRLAGFTEGVRRPEHWGCNFDKRDRLDSEYNPEPPTPVTRYPR